jgi:hypothetical protein
MWISTAVMGLLLACADYQQANVIKQLSSEWRLHPVSERPDHKYYLGDTFTGYKPYLGTLGWQSAFPTTAFQPGDWLLVPRFRTSAWWRLPPTQRLHWVARYSFSSRLPIRVMDVPDSAGFYASCWGSLPFVFTRHPLEVFDLFQVQ